MAEALDLYARFEPLIPFEPEIAGLHDRYVHLLTEFGAGRVLDIGCGSGGLLKKLGEAGIGAKGIDLSAEMVRRAQAQGVDAECVDLCDLGEIYDAATAVFDVLNYLDETALGRFLECAAKAIRPGGHFLFDVNTLYGFEEVAQGSLVLEKEGVHATVESVFDHNKLTSRFVMFEPGAEGLYRRSEGTITQLFHPVKTLEKLLKQAGFKPLGKFDLHLYHAPKPDKQLWVARRD
ncbi:MAG: class I SAM-dependent methyltransferase [Campylobacterales bacterium]